MYGHGGFWQELAPLYNSCYLSLIRCNTVCITRFESSREVRTWFWEIDHQGSTSDKHDTENHGIEGGTDCTRELLSNHKHCSSEAADCRSFTSPSCKHLSFSLLQWWIRSRVWHHTNHSDQAMILLTCLFLNMYEEAHCHPELMTLRWLDHQIW